MRTLEKVVFRVRDFDSDGNDQCNLHEYKLGLGPCEKTVTTLKAWFDGGILIILQECDDGTRQFFEYLPKLIVSKVSRYYTEDTYAGRE
jgi:hypothetical protein